MRDVAADYLEAMAERYAAYGAGEDDFADLSVSEQMTAAGFFHSREQYQHQVGQRAELVRAVLRTRTTPHSRPRSSMSDRQLVAEWVKCCADFPNLTAVHIDAVVGEELGVGERTVRARRGAWKLAGGIREQMRAIRPGVPST